MQGMSEINDSQTIGRNSIEGRPARRVGRQFHHPVFEIERTIHEIAIIAPASALPTLTVFSDP